MTTALSNITSILSSMTNWITTIIGTFTDNEILSVCIYLPIVSFVVFMVINIIKSFFR